MKNQVFIVFDSLRYDVFCKADTPFIKSLGKWEKAWTQGTYTLPAHVSFFVGKLPQTTNSADYYDTVASRYNSERGLYRDTEQLWRLSNPEAPRPARMVLDGVNIIDGFNKAGYLTLCTGAVNWFNPELPASQTLVKSFDRVAFLGHYAAIKQLAWAKDQLASAKKQYKPYFLFINLGETHHPFRHEACSWMAEASPYGYPEKCLHRQKRCLEFLDKQLESFFGNLENFDLVMCSDHGEALGEDGLWGHGFFHKTIMEVPLLITAR